MPYKLSPHTLNLYEACKRCFWLAVKEQKTRPSGPFPSLPSGMDLALKKYFDSYREQQKLPPELQEKIENAKLFSDTDLLTIWRNQRKGLLWTNNQNNTLMGALDEVLQTDDGKLIVLDYKTRGFPLKDTPNYYTLQLETYNFLLRKNGFETENYSHLLFFHPAEFTPQGATFKTQLVTIQTNADHAEQVFQNAICVLNNPKPKRQKNCIYCQWNRE